MTRSFLAVELPDELRSRIAALQDELRIRLGKELGNSARLQWVHPSSIHLTMKFLGDIDEAMIELIRQSVAEALSGLGGTEVELARLGCFPNPSAPRVLWLGPSANRPAADDPVGNLHRAVDMCMERFGFARETKAFTPHLTLARVKNGDRQVGAAVAKCGLLDRPLTVGTLPVRAVALMKSDLRPTGAVYTRLWEAEIGGR